MKFDFDAYLRQSCIDMGCTDEVIIENLMESIVSFYEGNTDIPVYSPESYSSFEQWNEEYENWKKK